MDKFCKFIVLEHQDAGQHVIQRGAKCIKVGAPVYAAVHAAGLLGRDVGKRAGNALCRRRRLALARQPRRNAKSGEPDTAGRVDEHIRRFDVLVN